MIFNKFFLLFIIFSFLCLDTFAAENKININSEISKEENDLLEIKQKILDDELTDFFMQKQEWERNKKARILLMNRYQIDENEIIPKRLQSRELNRVISLLYLPLISKLSTETSNIQVTVLKITISKNGKVVKSSIISSESKDNISITLLQETYKLDFSNLNEIDESFDHVFSVLIRRK